MTEELSPSELIQKIEEAGAKCLAWNIYDGGLRVEIDVHIPDGSVVIAHDVVTAVKQYVVSVNPNGLVTWKNMNHSTVVRFSFLQKKSPMVFDVYEDLLTRVEAGDPEAVQDILESKSKTGEGGYIFPEPGDVPTDLREGDWIQEFHDSMPKRDWDKLMKLLDEQDETDNFFLKLLHWLFWPVIFVLGLVAILCFFGLVVYPLIGVK